LSLSRTKLAVGVLALGAAISYLGVAGVRSGWVYYVGVDEYLATSEARSARARIHGIVAASGLRVGEDGQSARFDLRGQTSALPVEYRGPIPEMLAADRQVIVEGSLGPDGVFWADVLLTKCASKYDAQPSEPVERGTAP
jgi:cytochrome c-type biogenesis protein CcmE